MNADTGDDEYTQEDDEGGMDPAVSPILARQGGAVMVRDTETRNRRAVMLQ